MKKRGHGFEREQGGMDERTQREEKTRGWYNIIISKITETMKFKIPFVSHVH